MKKKNIKKSSLSKKKIAGAVAGIIIAASSFWVLKSGKHKVMLPTYQSIEVFDGDTFVTKEKQNVRLAAVDAPDRGNCGYEESKKQLEELIKGKPLYLKVVFFDQGKRLISYVYSPQGSVNVQMVKSGWARLAAASDPERVAFKAASQYAREHELGIYSPLCFSKEPDKPGCLIKGNIRYGRDDKIYILPGCPSYGQTLVQKDLGDRWFCSEAEAKKAGFERSGGCHDSIKLE